MKHLNKYLSLALALVLCLSLAACGESNEDYGDDGSDYNLYGVPDSFEGLVKDSEQMSNLYLYGGATSAQEIEQPKQNIVNRIIATMSAVFAPFVYILASIDCF